jgi:hypothetical protein
VRCWIAPRDVLPGTFWAEAIIEALDQSALMVLVFSEHSNGSRQVMREVERAASRDLPILPLRIDNVVPTKSIEYFLSSPHWLDALTPPLQQHLDRLAKNVQALLARDVNDETTLGSAPRIRANDLRSNALRSEPHGSNSKRAYRQVAIGSAILIVFAVLASAVLVSLMRGNGDDSAQAAAAEATASADETATAVRYANALATSAASDYIKAVSTQAAQQSSIDGTSSSILSAQNDPAAPTVRPLPGTEPSAPVVPTAPPAPVSTAPAAAPPATCSGPDFDSDGLCDSVDSCRNTNAAWRPVDSNGCGQREVDFDLDNVCDPGAVSSGPTNCVGVDLCRNTNSAWRPVDPDGCGEREVDFDLDGVCNPGAASAGPNNCSGVDQCPNSLPGHAVNSDGC